MGCENMLLEAKENAGESDVRASYPPGGPMGAWRLPGAGTPAQSSQGHLGMT